MCEPPCMDYIFVCKVSIGSITVNADYLMETIRENYFSKTIYLLVHSFIYPSTYIPLLILVLRHLSICPSIHSSTQPFNLLIHSSSHLAISIHTFTHSPIHLFVNPSVYPHIHVITHPFTHL